MLCFIHGASQASIFLVRIELVGRWWGEEKQPRNLRSNLSLILTPPLCALKAYDQSQGFWGWSVL